MSAMPVVEVVGVCLRAESCRSAQMAMGEGCLCSRVRRCQRGGEPGESWRACPAAWLWRRG